MLLARIITDVADGCLELTMQLRARGYQVEIVSPWQIPSTQADLEVRLDECDPEDVVAQAAQGSAGDLWVYVAPGALDPGAHPIRTIPLSTGSGAPMPPLSSVLPVIPKPLINTPPVIGALAMDSHPADPIRELHAFPMPQLVTQPDPLSAIVVEIPDVVPETDLPGPAARSESVERSPSACVVTPESPAENRARQETLPVARLPLPVQDENTSEIAPEQKSAPRESVPAKWLTDPAKPAAVTPAAFTLPIAPEPVRAKLLLPVENVRRAITRDVKWNFRPLQVACGLSMLAFLGWVLILTVRPEATASSVKEHVALPAPKIGSVPQAASKPLIPEEASKKSSAVRVQNNAAAVVHTAPRPAQEGPRAAKNETKTRSHDEGLIAEDTVVFYDHKPVPPPRKKAQSAPSVKRYNDQN